MARTSAPNLLFDAPPFVFTLFACIVAAGSVVMNPTVAPAWSTCPSVLPSIPRLLPCLSDSKTHPSILPCPAHLTAYPAFSSCPSDRRALPFCPCPAVPAFLSLPSFLACPSDILPCPSVLPLCPAHLPCPITTILGFFLSDACKFSMLDNCMMQHSAVHQKLKLLKPECCLQCVCPIDHLHNSWSNCHLA